MSIKITYLAKICLFLAAQRTAQMRKKERKIERKKDVGRTGFLEQKKNMGVVLHAVVYICSGSLTSVFFLFFFVFEEQSSLFFEDYEERKKVTSFLRSPRAYTRENKTPRTRK